MVNGIKTGDKDNSPKPLNNKNHQASSQKFRQLISQFFRIKKINALAGVFLFISILMT